MFKHPCRDKRQQILSRSPREQKGGGTQRLLAKIKRLATREKRTVVSGGGRLLPGVCESGTLAKAEHIQRRAGGRTLERPRGGGGKE